MTTGLGIAFNAKATEHLTKENPTKMRIDASWKTGPGLRLRPTTRKGGSNILVNLTPKGKTGVSIDIDETVMSKMIASGMPDGYLNPGDRLTMIQDRYGWVVLVADDQNELSIGSAVVTQPRNR